MNVPDFDYHLPESFIAQTPLEPRNSSRLLVLHRDSGRLEHRVFHEIGEYLKPNDLLILNQTRVIPARIYARKPTGGRVELLLLRRRDLLTWEALVGGKGLRIATKVRVENGPEAEIVEVLNGSERLIRFSETIEPYFPKVGHIPLPPYIHEKLKDPERYQTVFAREPGSAAAPTAGLHFTPRLLDELQAGGVKLAYVTLHVGLDTFAPVTEEKPEEHKIHTEWCELSSGTACAIRDARRAGGRVIAVGTTICENTGICCPADCKWWSALYRSDITLHPSRLSVQTGGCDDHQLPPAQIHAHHDGQRLCGAGENP